MQKVVSDVSQARLENNDFESLNKLERNPIFVLSIARREFDDYIKGNLILIPNKLVDLLYQYSEHCKLLVNSYDKENERKNHPEFKFKEMETLDNLGEVESFYKKNLSLFGYLLVNIKTLVGTEDLSKQTTKYRNDSKEWNNVKIQTINPEFDKSKWLNR